MQPAALVIADTGAPIPGHRDVDVVGQQDGPQGADEQPVPPILAGCARLTSPNMVTSASSSSCPVRSVITRAAS
jgi:hypothetical protein